VSTQNDCHLNGERVLQKHLGKQAGKMK